VRDDVRTSVVEHVAAPPAVLVCDETGLLTKGTKAVGVQRHDAGPAGRLEPGQLGVLLAYASPQGRTCLDRERSLPPSWAEDLARRREAGGPEEGCGATKPQLAPRRLARALTAGVRGPWVTAAAVSGSAPARRRGLEAPRHPGVRAVRAPARVWISTGARRQQVTAAQRAAMMRRRAWQRRSAGAGAKGPRRYAGAPPPGVGPTDPGWGRWLLGRRRLSTPTALAADVLLGPVTTAVPEMVRVAGRRGAIEEGLETATGEVGRDRLVSSDHPGAAGPCVSRGHPRPGGRRGRGNRGAWSPEEVLDIPR
jgi:hypothetical protein